MKKENKIYWVIGLIIVGLSLYNLGFFSLFPPTYRTFVQWTSNVCGGFTCDWWDDVPRTASGTGIFDFSQGTLRFETASQDWGQCGTQPDGTIIGVCCAIVSIYKDDILIDTLKWGYAGNRVGENSDPLIKVYYDDGTFCTGNCYPEKNGVQFTPNTWRVFYASACRNIQNDFTMYVPGSSFEMITSPLEENYPVGTEILLTITIINNLVPTQSILRVTYEIDILLGHQTRTDTYNMDLAMGENTQIITIPSTMPVSDLDISLEADMLFPTDRISGVNYGFEGVPRSMDYAPYFMLGTLTHEGFNLSIGGGVYPDCFDGIQNQDETGIDCGGVCDACGGDGTEQPRVYYRFSNNSCTQISMLPSLKTINDYNTLAICQSHITGGGGGGQTNQTCTDGIQNQNETGIDCGGNCNACEQPKNYNLYLIIAIIGVILGIYLWRRKKR